MVVFVQVVRGEPFADSWPCCSADIVCVCAFLCFVLWLESCGCDGAIKKGSCSGRRALVELRSPKSPLVLTIAMIAIIVLGIILIIVVSF